MIIVARDVSLRLATVLEHPLQAQQLVDSKSVLMVVVDGPKKFTCQGSFSGNCRSKYGYDELNHCSAPHG
jgi:hypothetical protein